MDSAQVSQTRQNYQFSREQMEGVMKRRFFYAPSFEIYGGISGLYDYGPAGCAFQANVIDEWRKHFVLEENMLEVDCSMLTPHTVLKTSGHVDKFSDWMCKDLKSGEIFRADHLIEQVLQNRLTEHKRICNQHERDNPKLLEGQKTTKGKNGLLFKELTEEEIEDYENILARIDGFSGEDLGNIMIKYNIRNPVTFEPLQPPTAFNLMFETAIGPSGQLKGFLRPETAQGQFLNFNKLLDFNSGKVPFASASIGKSFRNEISPRAGLLRVREFLMAEIEHFLDPLDKTHPKFKTVADLKVPLLHRSAQESGETTPIIMTLGQAVRMKMIDNETLGYFMGRIYQFLIKVGADPKKLRFRQHLDTEMAHYAADCWDTELKTSYGWIECVGCADRSAYDLTVHSKKSNEKMVVKQMLPSPVEITRWEIDINRKLFGPRFRKDSKIIETALLKSTQKELQKYASSLLKDGSFAITVPGFTEEFSIDSELVTIEKKKKLEHVREYVPNVIEPSFGIGRIIYSIFEHSFWVRPEDSARGVLSFPPLVAPTKVLIVPLSNNKDLIPITTKVSEALKSIKIPFKIDDSGVSIGKRYARNDELGTPFGITIDFDSLKDESVTLRERDSTKQIRGSISDIIQSIKDISYNNISWEDSTKSLKIFQS
ncbi:hypothetical protein TBLA_0F03110 [Henningerozyma blattae CBS 6284]|uniref:glycine--tRNA ligase n=1 Tax=Henningerozyma blattae (strain ATCC 34711 / CBS 6284 / DSM 70876 / NBRC 10599 / NRRL Y-10934 / UCD 77-7) TaxID=1071380 RepID=I2H648_HENB6|nr:hypothetical protein TBLA_0F03110 [Tetrapisispora blattae CBS 6284]CCH61850.1 hypothetical protein TBLA_0F03110 [Tetrapisispora blattae CBS 6284]